MATETKTNPAYITTEPNMKEIFIEKEFNFDRSLVFKAFTDPELYAQWIGPNNLTTKIERFEPRTAGSYRFVQSDKEGHEFGFHGVYHEVLSPERIISTMEYEGLPEKGHVEFDTTKFEALPGGRTRLTIQETYQSVEDKEEMLKSGMEHGITEGFERLEELLSRETNSWVI